MSNEWNHGYNVALGYTYGYYQETAPVWLDWALRLKNTTPPSAQSQHSGGKLRYLDLGCGQGFGLLLHAAAHPDMEFVGIDFNPVHIAHAQQLALRAGLHNVRFLEGDFAQLADAWPTELGSFHYTVLHGIYSWMAPSLRQAIVGCLQSAVHIGGVVYVSYNAMPGWAARMPLQHLLRRIDQTAGLSPVQAIEHGLRVCDRLQAAGAQVFADTPKLGLHIEKAVKPHSRNYVVQEYLHDNWHPLWFSQVVNELAVAKLLPVASATLPENYLPQVLPPAARQTVLEGSADPILQQELTDLVTNQTFRRDLFMRGAVQSWPVLGHQQVLRTTFCSLHPELEHDKRNTIKTGFGTVTGDAPLYDILREALNTGPQNVAQLLVLPGVAPRNLNDVVQALTFLMHARQVTLWQVKPDKTVAHRVNRAIAAAVCEGAPYGHAAAAHTSLGIPMNDLVLMLLDVCASQAGQKITPNALNQGLRDRLQRLGRQLQHEGKPVPPEELSAKLDIIVQQFIHTQLPEFKRIGVWPA